MKSELGGKFEDVILGLMMPAVDYDATQLRNAFKVGDNDADSHYITFFWMHYRMCNHWMLFFRVWVLMKIVSLKSCVLEKQVEYEILTLLIKDVRSYFKNYMNRTKFALIHGAFYTASCYIYDATGFNHFIFLTKSKELRKYFFLEDIF